MISTMARLGVALALGASFASSRERQDLAGSRVERLDGRPAPGRAGDAHALFARGKAAIEANAGDTFGAEREALERGIEDLRAADAAGYPGRKDLEALIARACNSLASHHARDDAERDAFIQREQKAYQAIMRIDPKDARARFAYTGNLTNRDQRKKAYREVLKVSPRHALARYSIAIMLDEEGQRDEASAEMMRAVEAFDAREAEEVGAEAVAMLRKNGKRRDAERASKLIQGKRRQRR